ncbi:D-cysteine desulfhydrase family protein [Alteromonas gracilis]
MSSRLHDRYPRLSLGHESLGSTPTPVRRVDADLELPIETWLKDESVFGDGDWGGNKVRKLEWILPEAERRGTRTLFTVGGIGTHWGLAAARYGQARGLRVVLGLVDQPVDDHVREQLARLESSGATIHRFATPGRLRAAAPLILARYRPWYLPAGGSNPVGTLGYVETALEIGEQVAAGTLPEPAAVVVPVGSGGTASGLALGLRLAGLRTRVVAAVVNDAIPLDPETLARLANRTLALLKVRGAPISMAGLRPTDLDARPDWLGTTYGDPTPASTAEVARAAALGIELEPVYTGKALAALRDLAPELDGPVLWLNTHGPR